jgi:arogenate dehydrogenase (NADP+)
MPAFVREIPDLCDYLEMGLNRVSRTVSKERTMKIGVVGLGLIGASWAGDLRGLGHEVVGVSRQESTCKRAMSKGFVDRAGIDLALLAETEIVFVCTPIDKILPTVQQLAAVLASGAIICDAGSVKESIVTAATEIWPNFVGGHPMAGKAESGLEVAELGMFEDKPFVVTPIEQTNPMAVTKLENLVRSMGCRLYRASPAEHDLAVAWISHLPVMIGASLIHGCLESCSPELLQLAQGLASSGFRDPNRVGGGNPDLGRMMAEYNRSALLDALRAYQQDLTETIGAIELENWDLLQAKLERNQVARPDFLDI